MGRRRNRGVIVSGFFGGVDENVLRFDSSDG